MSKLRSSDITPEELYRSRRAFMRQSGALAAGAVILSGCGGAAAGITTASTTASTTTTTAVAPPKPGTPAEPATPYEAITNYNNYYEFSTDKEPVAALARNFTTKPWTVVVSGFVAKPKTYATEDLLQRFPVEERIYRHRCVEGWSMVIPWQGFPLHKLLAEVEPTSQAKYVRFTTVSRPQEMPGQHDGYYSWPYVDGLRLDEAMNDLALMVTGLYGKPLPPQNGAPLRLAVPWKYGFKSVKAIVKIELVAEQPTSLWMTASPDEYGFYANVNPNVPHPRWSQSNERRIGETSRRKTLMFNGYAEEVAQLYTGMNLRTSF